MYPQPEGTMPIWMNVHCIMRLPIAEPDSFDETIKIKALSREPDNPGWTVIPVRHKLLFMVELEILNFT